MLQPHWLDDFFAEPKKFPEMLINSGGFKKAVEKAAKAFEESKEDAKKVLGVSGSSFEQAARVAFLETLNVRSKSRLGPWGTIVSINAEISKSRFKILVKRRDKN
jgi:hypothetical protein